MNDDGMYDRSGMRENTFLLEVDCLIVKILVYNLIVVRANVTRTLKIITDRMYAQYLNMNACKLNIYV